jgi:predicted AAA+ superfamily ATPase
MRDNEDTRIAEGEIHYGDAVEEKISLSERFGICLAFHAFRQEEYLCIVRHWLNRFGIDPDVDPDVVHTAALQWALAHGSRSGRSAQQFARDWAGRRRLEEQA